MTAGYFPPKSEMQAILGPVVKDAARQWGSKASVYHMTSTRQPDGSTVRALATVPTYTAVEVKLVQITNEEAQETFGQNSVVEFEGHMGKSGMTIGVDDVFTVTSGDFSGQSLRVAASLYRPLADKYLLGLVRWTGK